MATTSKNKTTKSPSPSDVPETKSIDTIKDAMSKLNKVYGAGSAFLMGENTVTENPFIPTGHIGIDHAIGLGIPIGKIIEVYGPESSGKTTFALEVARAFQQHGKSVAFIDLENSLELNHLEWMGVDPSKVLISQPESGDIALKITQELIDAGLDLIVIDSVAALVPQSELNGEIGDAQMGAQARLMSQALRIITKPANAKQCTVIFINQLRQKIGVMFGSPETTTGGQALKFYASVRLDIRRKDHISIKSDGAVSKDKKDGETIGQRCRLKVVKNKIGTPFKETMFEIYFPNAIQYGYSTGIIKEYSLLTEGVKLGIIDLSGSWYSYKSTKLGQGLDNSVNYLIENKDIVKEITADLRDVMHPKFSKGLGTTNDSKETTSKSEKDKK